MGKYQEALETIHGFILPRTAGKYKFYKSIETIKELVDKEISMKPLINNYGVSLIDKILGVEQTYTCPRCRNACLEMIAANKRNINRYCYDCGQKLDWSVE